jgi:wyosine [tRNA(Phe)-imidazoG37] synthetase (radical SAM superfamily)
MAKSEAGTALRIAGNECIILWEGGDPGKMARVLGLQKSVVYGPVDSRRLGRSLGINLSAITYKVCSFNCVYCHYGWTKHLTPDLSGYLDDLPTPAAVEEALERTLETLDPPPQYITFSGNGEPTLHPGFEEIVDRVRALRDRLCAGAEVAVLSNSTGLADEGVRRGLAKLDVRIMKLDAGTDEVLQRINRPAVDITVDAIVKGLKDLDDVTLQSVFVDGGVSNIGDDDVEAWLDRVEELGPRAMQVYSLENAPAMSTLVGVPHDRLAEIAARARARTGVEPAIY